MFFADYPVSGAVDTGASFVGYMPPEGTLVFHLWRELSEVRDSLTDIGLPYYNFDSYRRGFEYSRLFDIGYLGDLWCEVTGLPFDKNRAEMLIEMNVQRDIEKLRSRICRGLAEQ